MNLHEYQAKQLFRQAGIPLLIGEVIGSVEAVDGALERLGGAQWVVKAQIHAGGRGQSGGILTLSERQQVKDVVANMLGETLITPQNLPYGQPVHKILIEPSCDLTKAFYVAALVDCTVNRVVFMATETEGLEVEEIAEHHPEQIHKVAIDPVVGMQHYQCRKLGLKIGLAGAQLQQFCQILIALYQLFVDKDLTMIEISPLALTREGCLLALDAKINVDDNALVRQRALETLRDPTQEDDREQRATHYGLSYVSLSGNIGCVVNGAGLAMATMDLIKLHGGEPANFLDVGGATTPDRVVEAFKLILSGPRVRGILVNIFGGIVRCDLIAEGIIAAVKGAGVRLPIVVRLEGTNAEQGRDMLAESGLSILSVPDLDQAVQRVVEAASAAGG